MAAKALGQTPAIQRGSTVYCVCLHPSVTQHGLPGVVKGCLDTDCGVAGVSASLGPLAPSMFCIQYISPHIRYFGNILISVSKGKG